MANYQQVLRTVTYNNTSQNPNTTARVIEFTANDGALASNLATTTLSITAVNDAPVNTVPGAQSVNEDTPLAISGITVGDVDGNLQTVGLSVANGVLNVTLQGAASISGGANGTAGLDLSAAARRTSTPRWLPGLSRELELPRRRYAAGRQAPTATAPATPTRWISP